MKNIKHGIHMYDDNHWPEDQEVIQKILKHLGLDRSPDTHNRSPPASLFDPASAIL